VTRTRSLLEPLEPRDAPATLVGLNKLIKFGIVAESVGAVRIGGTPLPLTLGHVNDDFVIGIIADFKVNEI